jgi:hypothetical protein
MTQNKDLLDFFATCDGLMLFNSNEADEEDQTLRRINHLARHQDLKYLFSSLKKSSGKQKLQIPVAMVYTKSDKIDFGNSSLDDWIEENNSSLMETLRNNIQTFKTVFLSSQMAFMNVMNDDRFRLTETERSGGTVKCDTDVAYPLFWLIDQIQGPIQVLEATTKLKSSSKWWKISIGAILLIGIMGYGILNFLPSSDTSENQNLHNDSLVAPTIEPTQSIPVNIEIPEKWAYTISHLYNKKEARASKINFRQRPSTFGRPMAVIDCGTMIKIIDEPVIGEMTEGSNLWQKASFNGQIGYIHSNFLTASPADCPSE